MNRKKSLSKRSPRGVQGQTGESTKGRGTAATSDSSDGARDDPARELSCPFPSVTFRTWLSIWVCLHLLALALSFTSVVEPSSLQAKLSGLFYPYLRAGHFAADDRPVYLAHGNPSEQPHRLEITEDALSEAGQVDRCRWRSVGAGDYTASEASPGLAVSDRVARFLSTTATLAENEQPGVVAELLLPIARHFPEAKALRIVRIPTDLSDVNATPESPYVARIVRSVDSVGLIQLKPERLSSQAVADLQGAAQ
jgi:hypothetical protein